MINTLLVLVSLSVYTFAVSKTMFPRQGHCIPRDAQRVCSQKSNCCASRGIFPEGEISIIEGEERDEFNTCDRC